MAPGRASAGRIRKIGRASCRKECRYRCDWSSDVCSSDLWDERVPRSRPPGRPVHVKGLHPLWRLVGPQRDGSARSEERRVGKSVDIGVTGVQTCALPIFGMNAFPGPDPQGVPYTSKAFTLYGAWSGLSGTDP